MPYLKEDESCPAMVLVSGGGSTALDEWVRVWNGRGYAAIALDICGCKPEIPIPQQGGLPKKKHDFPGPSGWQASYAQMNEKTENHWQYHAITALLRAHTIISNTKGVDPKRVGITGMSWGGIITCLMMGIDSRYAAGIPVYGCGFLSEISWGQGYKQYDDAKPEDIRKWHKYWDPMHYLPNTKIPTLWVTGTNDGFSLDIFKKSYSLTSDPTISIIFEMPHGIQCAWAPKEIHHFTDSIFRGGAPLPKHIKTHIENGKIISLFQSARPLMKAEILYTRALGMWVDRKWRKISVLPEEIDNVYKIITELPVGVTAAFVNAWDDRDVFVSSPHLEVINGIAKP